MEQLEFIPSPRWHADPREAVLELAKSLEGGK